jgi:antitoxin MazE
MPPLSSTEVAKWGNATAIRIPKSIMQKANLHEGDAVDFEVKAPGVIVVRASRIQATLEDLVAGITPKNRHGETDWGKPRGNEVW